MHFLAFFFWVAVSCISAEDQSLKNTVSDEIKPRGGRNYDNYYDADSFNSDSDQSDNMDFKEEDSPVPPPRGDEKYSFPSYDKGYAPKPPAGLPFYGGYKGLPYGYPGLKGLPAPVPDQKAEMVMMMDLMNKLNGVPKKEDKGFLSKLMDHKPALIASIIPLSIILFSVAPIVIKYFQSGANMPSMVTTIASSKMGRALTDREYLANTVENVVDFAARALEEDDCIQETLCKELVSRGGKKNVKTVASVITHVSRDDWLKSFGAKELFNSLQDGDCKRACPKGLISRRR
ncbi:unnamed protein product [Larinioides sclopetarius]|uniref:Uncharacterized protein n=1 Tax=Larinioides sclopetarius TaxID=280406 RepID=A0AAV1ZFX2_9ARAC